MSLSIVTKNNERIVGGYNANRLSVFSVGDYDFLTKDLLGVVGSLASSPTDCDNVQVRSKPDLVAMEDKLTNAYIRLSQRNPLNILPEVYFLENARLKRGNYLDLSVNESEFQVGRYVIAGAESHLVLESLVCGGLFGWPATHEPVSVQQCREKILHSRKPFFRELVKSVPRLSNSRS